MAEKFIMWIEPHTPENPDRPCYECVLQHGPMCLDRSYCRFKETGKTWKKHLPNISGRCNCIHTDDCDIDVSVCGDLCPEFATAF